MYVNRAIATTPKGYVISTTWREAHSNWIVTKCVLRVLFSDVINCAKSHLSNNNSFLRQGDPENWVFPLT